jgi:hypothetical protein
VSNTNLLAQTVRNSLFATVTPILLACALLLGPIRGNRQWQLLVSCHNHGHRLSLHLMPGDSFQTSWHPPYFPGKAGHLMLTSISKTLGRHLQCHHGASGKGAGGWQAINLPPEKWDEVVRRWPDQGVWDGVPLFWCGRPNPNQVRLLAVVPKSGLPVSIGKVSERHLLSQIGQLNQILEGMGERPVPLNIPDNVDWDKAPPWPVTPSPAAASAREP